MSEQWRVGCEECGDPARDKLRMHSRTGENDEGDTVVECNNCNHRRTVGTGDDGADGENSDGSSAATDGGTDAIGNEPSVQGEIGGWGQ